jgi:hypothetical protein
MRDRLVTIDSTQVLALHGWQALRPDHAPTYILELNQQLKASSAQSSFTKLILSYRSQSKERQIGLPFAYQKLGTFLIISVSL